MKELSAQSLEKLEQLKEKYNASLPSKLEYLEQLWLSCIDQRFTSESLNELEAGLHKLSGSAGLYGHADISACAKRFECLVMQHKHDSDKPCLQSLLMDAMADMQAIIESKIT